MAEPSLIERVARILARSDGVPDDASTGDYLRNAQDLLARTPQPEIILSATVEAFKCNNPNHARGCGLGWRLVACEEKEAHTWLARITAGNSVVWGSNQTESQSRKAATAAMLERLAEGVQVNAWGII